LDKNCSDGCSGTLKKTCYCPSPCTPDSCKLGTSETAGSPATPFHPVGTTDLYAKYDCTNDCDDPQSRSCYCDICNDAPVCETIFSATPVSYYGKVPDNLTPKCRNGNSNTPDRDTLCSFTYRDCYCKEFKSCPNPLTNTGTSNLVLEGFRENTNDCGVSPIESEDDCYEVFSTQPTETFSIVDPGDGEGENPPNGYDFKSITQTGIFGDETTRKKDLNDPTRPLTMRATYTDANGASDIEGMFVWFRNEIYNDPVLGTPVHLIPSIGTNQAPSNGSWGFMLRRSGSDWIPYVTNYDSAPSQWNPISFEMYPTIDGYESFYINGTTNQPMVEVTILKKPETSMLEPNKVVMEFSLRFTNSGTSFGASAMQGNYKIYTMGLDKFSFTPYDNYNAPNTPVIDYGAYWTSEYERNPDTNLSHYWSSDQLRYKEGVQDYAKAWSDSGKTWTLDFTNPRIVTFTKTISENKITVSWQVDNDGDGRNLYSIVGNVYSTAGADARQITLSSSSSSIIVRAPFIPTPVDNTYIGRLIENTTDARYWSFKVDENMNTSSHSGSVTLDIGNNTKGIISIYLTVFDYSGNVITTNPALQENLEDRFLTGGGLAFSPSTTFAQLTPIDDSLWENTLPPYRTPSEGIFPSEGLLRGKAGFTSEMLANYSSSLENSDPTEAKSYRLTGFSSFIRTDTPSLYESLKRKYELHKKYIESLTETTITSGSISLLPTCSTTHCMYTRTGDLTINSGLLCNKQALIFVEGDLTINPPIHSDTTTSIGNSNGCIFVVGGIVNIQPGGRASTSTNFRFDRINAFIVSDGVITIQHDPYTSPLLNPNKIVDGVYINGGLISRGAADSIDIKRYLRLEERLVYPVFAIDLHPKYGILAEEFFGNSYVIQSTEVGLKPY